MLKDKIAYGCFDPKALLAGQALTRMAAKVPGGTEVHYLHPGPSLRDVGVAEGLHHEWVNVLIRVPPLHGLTPVARGLAVSGAVPVHVGRLWLFAVSRPVQQN